MSEDRLSPWFVLFVRQAVFPRTPLAGNHQTADCCQLHGLLTPGRISVGRPHCVIPVRGAVTGRKYHCPLCLSSPPPEAIRVLLIGWVARPSKRSLCAPSAWLGAHHPGTGNVSDECVFSCQCEEENKSPQYSEAEKIRKTATLFQKKEQTFCPNLQY